MGSQIPARHPQKIVMNTFSFGIFSFSLVRHYAIRPVVGLCCETYSKPPPGLQGNSDNDIQPGHRISRAQV